MFTSGTTYSKGINCKGIDFSRLVIQSKVLAVANVRSVWKLSSQFYLSRASITKRVFTSPKLRDISNIPSSKLRKRARKISKAPYPGKKRKIGWSRLPLILSQYPCFHFTLQSPNVPKEAAEQLLQLTHTLRQTTDPTVSVPVCVRTCVPMWFAFIYLHVSPGTVSGLLPLHQTAAADLSPTISLPRGEHRPRCQQGLPLKVCSALYAPSRFVHFGSYRKRAVVGRTPLNTVALCVFRFLPSLARGLLQKSLANCSIQETPDADNTRDFTCASQPLAYTRLASSFLCQTKFNFRVFVVARGYDWLAQLPRSSEVVGSNQGSDLPVWSLHVLHMPACVFSGYSYILKACMVR